MTAMNWEGLKNKSIPSAYAYYELPAVGSWRDQSRYFTNNQNNRSKCKNRNVNQQKTNNEVNQRLHGITLVVNYMKTDHYRNRPECEKKQIVEALKSSLSKLLLSGLTSELHNNTVVKEARSYCRI